MTATAPVADPAGISVGSIGAPVLLTAMDRDLRVWSGHSAVHGALPTVDLHGLLGVLDAVRVHGRGGAGFPLADKVRSLRRGERPVVVVNAAEGEPGSAKDRILMTRAPHLVLDGAAVVANAIGTTRIVVATTSAPVAAEIQAAAGGRGDARLFEVRVVPDRFVIGEARTLIDALDGGRGVPPGRRVLPTDRGLGGAPTLLSNAETFAHVAVAVRRGPSSAATTLVTLSGAVARPGVVEVPLGLPLSDLLTACGAVADPQGVLVGGLHGAWIPPRTDVRLDPVSMTEVGASLGAGVVVVLGPDTCASAELGRAARWLADESVRQCGPCAFGLPALAADVAALVAGSPGTGAARRHAALVTGRGACAHPDGAARFVSSGLAAFADDLAVHTARGGCGRPDLHHLATDRRRAGGTR